MEQLKQISEFLGIEINPESENFMQEFKEQYNQKHIARNKVFEDDEMSKAVHGRILSPVSKTIKKGFKNFVELDEEEIKDKTYDQLFEIGMSKISEMISKKEEEMKNQLSKGTNDRILDLENQLKETKTFWEQDRNANNVLKQDLANKENEFIKFKENFVKDQKVNDIYNKTKFNSKVDDITLKGFKSHIGEIAEIKLSESGDLIVVDRNTGKRFEHPSKSAEYLTPEELITSEADKRGYLAKAEQQQHQAPQNPQGQQQNQPDRPTFVRIAKPVG